MVTNMNTPRADAAQYSSSLIDVARQLEVELQTQKDFLEEYSAAWWWCANNNAQLQHGEFDNPSLTFTVVTLGPEGRCYHAPTPALAVERAIRKIV